MQQDVYIMVSNRVQLEQLAVKSVRQPSKGMPVRRLKTGERPFHSLPGQARPYMSVVGNVKVIVEICEVVVNDGVVERKRKHSQEKAQNCVLLLPGKEQP